MCLIVTILMLVLSIQNLINHQWSIGILQLVIAIGFTIILGRNIQMSRCERTGECSGCTLPNWLTRWFRKRDSDH
ncbi:hypothetical protein ACM66Z_02980 [Sulfurovum sp. ST-21]|uniref:Uncharacterized protein n=1 Tax=Sulfurovum indicum TaxID=2779528 RepID=A0A7M1S4V3_9BACT|nr:hypothetical protein [Sulfurovum indicum]QOR62455.1 hypothetical protein IMZ28_02965 [Sulfurovum indicum]